MKEMRIEYYISFMSRILGVSASGYYAWLNRKPSKRQQEEARLEIEIRAAHKKGQGISLVRRDCKRSYYQTGLKQGYAE